MALLSAIIRQHGVQHVVSLSSGVHPQRIHHIVRTSLGTTQVQRRDVGGARSCQVPSSTRMQE